MAPAAPAAKQAEQEAPPSTVIEDLVAANRVLAQQGIVDGYGHVSVRNPDNPARYFLSRSLAPELVTADDILELDLDSRVLNAQGRNSYQERFIHGVIFHADASGPTRRRLRTATCALSTLRRTAALRRFAAWVTDANGQALAASTSIRRPSRSCSVMEQRESTPPFGPFMSASRTVR